jgi:MoxR-like ATPase
MGPARRVGYLPTPPLPTGLVGDLARTRAITQGLKDCSNRDVSRVAGTAGRTEQMSTTVAGTVAAAVSEAAPPPLPLDEVADVAERIVASVSTVIEGKAEVVRLSTVVLLAGGHLLVEDVPGVGKTMLAKSLARSVDCSMRRIQFTPDLMPSDVTGVSVFNQQTREFEFRPGGIFANVVLGDEINRASPKTQSALLEAMEEGQVSVDGATYRLDAPFLVVATQNPVEMEGTYPLPEAQRDRFMVQTAVGYPTSTDEVAMIDTQAGESSLVSQRAVTSADEVARSIAAVRGVHVADAVKRYVVDLVTATRRSAELRLGASPRATIHLIRAARARAAVDGRDYVVPDDVQALAVPVLSHRLLLTAEAQIARRTSAELVAEIVRSEPTPGPDLSHR